MSEAPEPVAEAFRLLRTALPRTPSPRRILLTGAEASAPAAEVAAGLARALAGAGARVVAVDCNLRAPQLHLCFGAANEAGALQPIPTPAGELHLMAAGPPGQESLESLAWERFTGLLDDLLEKADYLVLSAPAVTASADAALVATRADAVLLVLEAGRSDAEAARRAVMLLKQVNAPLVGAVLAH